MAFSDDDLFLINRLGKSYKITAKTIDDEINPVGTVDTPVFLSPLDEQGFDIKSDIIEKELSNDGSTATVRLASDKNLSLVGNPGDTINLAVTQSPSYIPVSTKITNVVKAGDDYTLSFKSINFDYKFFAAW